jgi:hypothetical protein
MEMGMAFPRLFRSRAAVGFAGAWMAMLAMCMDPLRSLAAEFRVESPLDYQVVQRATPQAGSVTVRGTTPSAGPVSIRIQGEGVSGPYDSAWVQTESIGSEPRFSSVFTLPAGGWYAVTVRYGAAGPERREIRVDHLGIGEVFVGAGQSNSTNYGEERQKPETGKVSTFDGTSWRIANDPQPGTFDHSGGGSFWPSFGDELVRRLGVPIGVAVTGNGATSVLQWQPKGTRVGIRPTAYAFVRAVGTNEWECDGALFDHLAKRVAQLGPRGFRAVLWHQGESDANQPNPTPRRITGPEYASNLERLIRGQREAAGWDLPWFVALVSYHVPDDPGSGVIRDAQMDLWRRGVALEGPDTDALQGDHRDGGGRGVHFSGKGQRAHGQLWAGKVSGWLKSSGPQLPQK